MTTTTLRPGYSLGRIVLRASRGSGTLRFGETDADVKVKLSPFFQGPEGPPGPRGDPGSSGLSSYTHVQSVPSDTWIIDHQLGFRPNVHVVDTNGDECEGEIHNVNLNRLDLIFSSPFAGTARLI